MWNQTKNKEKSYQSPEYKHFLILKSINYFVIASLLASTGLGVFFIYKNIFNTMEQINTIALLNNSVNIETINFNQYDKVEKAWQEKYRPINIELKRDPFNPLPTETPTSTEKIEEK